MLTRSSLLFCRILLSFVSKLQIPLNHFIQDDINTYYLVNGVRQKTYAVEGNPSLLNYSLAERERGKSAAELFSQALWKVSFQELTNTGRLHGTWEGSALVLAICVLATGCRHMTR